jgi:hypothetical protein
MSSTYYLDINSSYRDTSKYPNPCDFGITFKTNYSTGSYSQGLPAYSNSFYNSSSIDPDFVNNDLRLENCIIDNYKQIDNYSVININNSYYFVCGHTNPGTTPTIYYKNNLLYSYPTTEYTNVSSFFLMKFNFTNQDIYEWGVYLQVNTGSTGTINNTSRAVFQFDQQQNIVLEFDFNAPEFTITKIDNAFSKTNLLNITNPAGTNMCQCIIKLDVNGNLGLYKGRNWGYHILSSNFDLYKTSESGQSSLTLDDSDNIITTSNVSDVPLNPYTAIFPASDTQTNNGTLPFFAPYGTYQISTGTSNIYIWMTPTVFGNNFSQTGAIAFANNSSTGMSYLGRAQIPYLTPLNISGLIYGKFVECNNNLYNFYSVYYVPNINLPQYSFICKVDYMNYQITNLTTTPDKINNYPDMVAIGTNLFMIGYATETFNLVVYKYDTITNNISTINTYYLPFTNSTAKHFWFKSYTVGDIIYCVVQEHFNISGVSIEPSMKGYIFSINTTTGTITELSNYILPVSSVNDMIMTTNSTTRFCCFSSLATNILYILNITDLYNPILTTITVGTNGYCGTFKVNTLTDIKYYLIVQSRGSNNGFIYDVSNLSNIILVKFLSYPILPKYGNKSVITYVDNDNTLYCSNFSYNQTIFLVSIFIKYKTNFTNTVLTSEHYNLNFSNTLSIPTSNANYNMFKVISSLQNNYCLVCSNTEMYFYNITSIINSSLYFTYNFSFLGVPVDTTSYYFNNYVYISVSSQDTCYIFSIISNSNTDLDLNSITLLQEITLTGEVIKQSFIIFNNINLCLFIVCNSNAIYCYSYDETNLQFIFKSRLTYTTNIVFNGGFIKYYPAYDTFMLTTITSSFNVPRPAQYPFLYSGFINNININDINNVYFYNRFASGFNPQTKFSISTFVFDDVNYALFTYDYSTTSAKRDQGLVLNINDYNNFVSLSVIPWYSNYYSKPPCTAFTTSNLAYTIATVNFAIGYTGPYDQATGGYIFPTDYILMTSFDGKDLIAIQTTAQTPGNVIQIDTISYDNKIMLVCLLNNSSIYLYDMTDPIFASTNQNLSTVSNTYTGNVNFGNSFVTKILNDGTTNFSSFIGGNISQTYISKFVNCSNIVIDRTKSFLYIVGSWSDTCQFYSLTSTGSYNLDTQLYYPDSSNNAMVIKMDINTGKFIWVLPALGDKIDFFIKCDYSSLTNSIFIIGYSQSSLLKIYKAQSGLSRLFPELVQYIITTFSFGSGFVINLSDDGTFNFSNLIYSLEDSTYVKVYDISYNSSKDTYIIAGITNSNYIKCLDSTQANVQDLFSNNDIINQENIIIYKFNNKGLYMTSNLILTPNKNTYINDIKEYTTNNSIFLCLSSYNVSLNSYTYYYNKDGTLGKKDPSIINKYEGFIVKYLDDSSYTNSSGQKFSQIVIKSNITYPFSNNLYQNYKLFLQGNYKDSVLNNNFIIRQNFTDDNGNGVFLLNNYIDTSKLIRAFTTINYNTGSNNYYNFSLSISNLAGVYNYLSINTGTNTLEGLFQGTIDTSTANYILIPSYYTGTTNTYTKVIPITNISTTDSVLGTLYLFTVNDIYDILNNPIRNYPYLYIGQFNKSVYYNLQFFPASIISPTYFLVKILSITLPNRPIINLSNEYGGQRSFNDLPFIYVSIYNEDDFGNYDSQIVNIIYDNTVLTTKPYPQYQLNISNQSINNNFATFTSDYSAKIKFSPGYYNLRIKIMDPDGNPLSFDTSNTKVNDSTYFKGVVPSKLLNTYLRLSATKI